MNAYDNLVPELILRAVAITALDCIPDTQRTALVSLLPQALPLVDRGPKLGQHSVAWRLSLRQCLVECQV